MQNHMGVLILKKRKERYHLPLSMSNTKITPVKTKLRVLLSTRRRGGGNLLRKIATGVRLGSNLILDAARSTGKRREKQKRYYIKKSLPPKPWLEISLPQPGHVDSRGVATRRGRKTTDSEKELFRGVRETERGAGSL